MVNDVIFGYAPEYVQMAQLAAYLKYHYEVTAVSNLTSNHRNGLCIGYD